MSARLGGVFMLVFIALVGALAQTERHVALSGNLQPPGTSSLALSATAAGDLTGKLSVGITTEGTLVTGGSWHFQVSRTGPDGETQDVGYLAGTIETRGTVTTDAAGVITLASLRLAVVEGKGEYQGTTGIGSLDGSVNPKSGTPFTGSATFTFDR